MSFQQTFAGGVHPASTTVDLTGAMTRDAQDTYVKVLPWAALFALASVSVGEQIGEETFLGYIGDILGYDPSTNVATGNFTWISDDGDVICFRVNANRVNYLAKHVIEFYDGDTYQPLLVMESDGVLLQYTNYVTSANGSFRWTLPEIAVSMAKQLQASEVVRRLASLVGVETINVADFDAIMSDLGDQLSPDVSEVLANLKSSGSLISGSSVFATLQNIYGGFSHATPNQDLPDTIEFDTNNYALKSFFGTVMNDFIPTALGAIGTVVMVTGSIVGAVAGIVLTAGSWIVDKVRSSRVLGVEEIYDADASHHEIACPLFQVELNFNQGPELMRKIISDYGIAKVTTPWCNIYAWRNDSLMRVAGYANLDINIPPTYPADGVESGFFAMERVDVDKVEATIKSITSFNEARETGFGPNGCIPANEYANRGLTADLRGGVIGGDAAASKAMAMAGLLYHRLTASATTASTKTIYWNETAFPTLPEAFDSFEEYVSDDISTLPFYLAICAKYGAAPWKLFVNYLAPALQALANNDPLQFLSSILTSSDSLMNVSESQAVIMPVLNFRSEFQAIPPRYDASTLLPAILISVVSIAAIAGTIAITKSIIKRRTTRTLTARYSTVQDKLKATQDAASAYGENSAEFKSAYKDYVKTTKRYNWLAKLSGSATISQVDGWLSAGESSFTSVVPEAGSNPISDYAESYVATELGLNQSTPSTTIDDVLTAIIGPRVQNTNPI